MNRRGTQVELGNHGIQRAVGAEPAGQRGLPQGPTLARGGPVDIEGKHGPVRQALPLPAGHDQRPADTLDQMADGEPARRISRLHLLAIHQERARTQDNFTFPQPDQGRDLSRVGWDGRGGHRAEVQAQFMARGGSDGPFAGRLLTAQLDDGQRLVSPCA